MRGIPGSGKTTWAKKMWPDAVHCSADHYFTQEGEYRFDAQLLKEAHRACFDKFKRALYDKAPIIVVDNTNTRLFEFAHYIYEALMMDDYEVRVVRTECSVETAAARGTHGVPSHKVAEMAARMRPYYNEAILNTEIEREIA